MKWIALISEGIGVFFVISGLIQILLIIGSRAK